MHPSNKVGSTLDEASSNQASLNLFSSNSVIGVGLLDGSINSNGNGNSTNSVNDLSTSFSKLNTENIAQMINQAQLLNLNGDVSKSVASSTTSIIGHPPININTHSNNHNPITMNVMSAQAKNTMPNNFFRPNKFNNNNYNMNYNNNHNNNNNRSQMPYKNVRPPLNQSHQSLMAMNFNFQHIPSMNLNPNGSHTNQPNVYMPFGNNTAPFNHPNSFFMQQTNAASQPIQTHPSYFYNTNSFNNNKQSYMNYKSYLQAKKAENMHKLWPHSVKNSQNNSKNSTSNATVSDKSKENESSSSSSTSNSNNQNEKSSDSDKNNNADDLQSPTEASNLKTPMCLINELVKYNKIKHEYVLLDEIGPAHKKKFFVSLKLDAGGQNEEAFTANSTSIKKAQHAAAEIALKQTKFKKPVSRNEKTRRSNEVSLVEDPAKIKDYIKATTQENYKKRTNPALAPTVLLNSLAMKLGLVANYTHTLTSASNNIVLDVEAMTSTSNPTEKPIDPKQQDTAPLLQETNNTSFSSDLNQSFEMKSTNYTNFMKNDYEPFKYPQDDIVTNKEANDNNNKTASFNPSQIKVLVNPNKEMLNCNSRYNSNNNYSNNNYKGISRIKKKTDNLKQFFYVKLKFAETEFNGEGITLQLAKHDAASKALTHYSNAENFLKAKALSSSGQNKNAKAYRPPQFYKQQNENVEKNQSSTMETSENNSCETKNSSSESKSSLNKLKKSNDKTNEENELTNTSINETNSSNLKSEIMLVHEYAYRLKKSVTFELVQESGPSHIKKFVTKCSIGKKSDTSTISTDENTESSVDNKTKQEKDENTEENKSEFESCYFEALGEGNSKKLSKKNSAIEILKILKDKFEPLFMISSKKVNRVDFANSKSNDKYRSGDSNSENTASNRFRKSKAKNIVKIKKTSPDYGKGSINPISRLIQIQQAKKEPEPEFTFIVQNKKKTEQNNRNKRTEFVIQVTLTTNSNNVGKDENGNNTNEDKTATDSKSQLVKLQCEGKGSTKKEAKKNAAEAMLIKLGYQSKASVLKPSIKTNTQNITVNSSNTAQSTITPSTSTTGDIIIIADPPNSDKVVNNSNEKNEKRVTFVEDNNVTIQPDDYRNSSITEKKNKENISKKLPTSQNHHQQKLKSIKEQLKLNSNTDETTLTYLDKKSLETVYKIASELLESFKIKKEPQSENGNDSTNLNENQIPSSSSTKANSQVEFCSPTAERILKENGDSSVIVQEIETERETEEKKIQFKILNGGNNDINYKKALDYLGMVMKFKINYQSLLGRDGNVCSYVNLTILPETEKPLNGQGVTHIESSNAAALCALQYLSAKCQKN